MDVRHRIVGARLVQYEFVPGREVEQVDVEAIVRTFEAAGSVRSQNRAVPIVHPDDPVPFDRDPMLRSGCDRDRYLLVCFQVIGVDVAVSVVLAEFVPVVQPHQPLSRDLQAGPLRRNLCDPTPVAGVEVQHEYVIGQAPCRTRVVIVRLDLPALVGPGDGVAGYDGSSFPMAVVGELPYLPGPNVCQVDLSVPANPHQTVPGQVCGPEFRAQLDHLEAG